MTVFRVSLVTALAGAYLLPVLVSIVVVPASRILFADDYGLGASVFSVALESIFVLYSFSLFSTLGFFVGLLVYFFMGVHRLMVRFLVTVLLVAVNVVPAEKLLYGLEYFPSLGKFFDVRGSMVFSLSIGLLAICLILVFSSRLVARCAD